MMMAIMMNIMTTMMMVTSMVSMTTHLLLHKQQHVPLIINVAMFMIVMSESVSSYNLFGAEPYA